MENDEIVVDPDKPFRFWELVGKPHYETLPGETAGEFLARINDPSKWLYGSELRDEMMLRTASTLPRFSNLSRKAFIHYAGSRYNPHTITFMQETELRTLIKWLIEYKVEGRVKGYDRELVDYVLRDFIYKLLEIPFPEDYKPLDREILPEFRSPYHGITESPPN